LSGWRNNNMSTEIVSQVINLSKRVYNLSQRFKDVEFQHELLDLHEEITTFRLEISRLVDENESLKLELKHKTEQKPTTIDGCYVFDDEPDRLYCPTCWDVKALKVLTFKLHGPYRKCNNCPSDSIIK